jgi:hypothetical protein
MTVRQVRSEPGLAGFFAAAVAVITAAVCLYAIRQADPDLFGYLSYGRLFVEQGGVQVRDPFAFTSAGRTWVTFEYGAHIALWWAYAHGGVLGLLALKSALGGVALYFLYDALRLGTGNARVWLPIFVLCASAISRYCLFRPQLFTFALFAVFVSVLLRYVLRRRAPLWVLPLLMIGWANTHGGFVAGLGAIGLTLLLTLSELLGHDKTSRVDVLTRTRTLAMVLVAALAATLATPLGFGLWQYVAVELVHGTNRRYIREWAPATLANDPWSAGVLVLLSTLVVLVGTISTAKSSGRVPRGEGPAPICWTLSCVPLIAMAFLSVRHVPLAAMWTGPVLVYVAARVEGDLGARAAYRRSWFLLRGLALVPAWLTFAVVYHDPQPAIQVAGYGLGRTSPCRAVEFLRASGASGRIYTPLWWGSYITWALYPQFLVSMDGRNISLFPDSMVLDNLRFYLEPAGADTSLPARLGSEFIIVPTDSPALSPTLADARWHAIYRDVDAAVFERGDASRQQRFSDAGAAADRDCRIGL